MNGEVRFPAMRGEVLGIATYRGLGRLSDVARISQPDIFDQKGNPRGTQRDLNVAHARAAHAYVLEHKLAFWPEVVLCCRVPEVLEFEELDGETDSGVLRINLDRVNELRSQARIAISRLDGNHRLHFADGSVEGYDAVERSASFCILMGLSREEEIGLFSDINNNQRRMNTSHLDSIVVRLTPEDRLKVENPALYIAERLGNDAESPLAGLVYAGGRRSADFQVPKRTLQTGIRYLRQRSTKIHQLDDIEAEYLFVRNFWQALRKWVPAAWEQPRKYLLLRGAGLWGACFLGGMVIDRCLEKGQYTVSDILQTLQSGASWDWSTQGDFKGYSGRGGALEIGTKIYAEFATESGVSIRKLAEKIRAE